MVRDVPYVAHWIATDDFRASRGSGVRSIPRGASATSATGSTASLPASSMTVAVTRDRQAFPRRGTEVDNGEWGVVYRPQCAA